MFTASVLALVFLGLVIPVLMGIMSLALRVFGWTVRASSYISTRISMCYFSIFCWDIVIITKAII